MRTAVGRRNFWRWLAGVAVMFGAVAVLGSCGVVSAMLDTQQALRDAGYQSVHVGFHDNGGADDVDVTVTISARPTEADARNVASVVWAKLHERFDTLDVTVHGDGTSVSRQFSFDQLEQAFGPRNPSYNSTTVGDSVKQLGFEVLGGLAVIGLVIVLAAVLLTRRRRRKRPAAGPGGPYPYLPGAPGPGPAPGVPVPAVGVPGVPGVPGPAPGAGSPPPGWPLWPPPPHPPRPVAPAPPPVPPPATPPPASPPGPEGWPEPPPSA